jgi:hypothetical protein
MSGQSGADARISLLTATRICERAHARWTEAGQPAGGLASFWEAAAQEIRADEAAYDEAVAESFPASDPPAHSGTTD